jgi:hypothetical protein
MASDAGFADATHRAAAAVAACSDASSLPASMATSDLETAKMPMPPLDWDFLFEVYPRVDRDGLFRKYELPDAQTARLTKLATSAPHYCGMLSVTGRRLVDLAGRGLLGELHELLLELRQDELLLGYSHRMFIVAVLQRQLHVVRDSGSELGRMMPRDLHIDTSQLLTLLDPSYW